MAEYPGVEQLPSGRWRARAWNSEAPNPKSKTGKGKRVTVPDTFATAEDAWLAKRRVEKATDAAYVLADQEKPRRRHQRAVELQPVGQCVTRWIDEQVRIKAWRSPQSEETARCHQRAIVRYFGDLAVGKLDDDAVRRWVDDLAAMGLAVNTRKARLSILTRALAAAVESGLLEVNPATKITVAAKVAEMQPDRRRIAEWELMLLVAFMPHWLYPSLFLAHDAGLRLEEVCGLRWRNVHLDGEPWVSVADVIRKDGSEDSVPKSGKARRVPLSTRTVDALRVVRAAFPCDDPNGRVFRTPQSPRHAGNDRCPQGTLQNAWEAARERSRLVDPQPRFHDLRHAFGTKLAEANVGIETIRELMGHADYKTTRIYIRTAPDWQRQDAIARTFGNL
jgi:integrase